MAEFSQFARREFLNAAGAAACICIVRVGIGE